MTHGTEEGHGSVSVSRGIFRGRGLNSRAAARGSYPLREGRRRIRSPSGGEPRYRPRMAYSSFSEFLTALDLAGELRRIATPYGLVISTR